MFPYMIDINKQGTLSNTAREKLNPYVLWIKLGAIYYNTLEFVMTCRVEKNWWQVESHYSYRVQNFSKTKIIAPKQILGSPTCMPSDFPKNLPWVCTYTTNFLCINRGGGLTHCDSHVSFQVSNGESPSWVFNP